MPLTGSADHDEQAPGGVSSAAARQERALSEARRLIASARAITVLTGAGISTASGIPDFRGPQGVWTRNPAAERLSSYQEYLADPELRRRAWRNRLEHPAWAAEPNAAHLALAALERSGRLHALITQNIDGLHQKAGNNPSTVIEIHGTMSRAVCVSCGLQSPMTELLARVEAGEDDPPCLACGGIQKSATISFGQALDPQVLRAAQRAALSCDLFLALGTTLQVEPAASLPGLARQCGARLVVVNQGPTSYDAVADVRLDGPLEQLLPRLVD